MLTTLYTVLIQIQKVFVFEFESNLNSNFNLFENSSKMNQFQFYSQMRSYKLHPETCDKNLRKHYLLFH
jgi:hypothetical protein